MKPIPTIDKSYLTKLEMDKQDALAEIAARWYAAMLKNEKQEAVK